MFDITNKDLIKRIINQRDDSEIIIPLLVISNIFILLRIYMIHLITDSYFTIL